MVVEQDEVRREVDERGNASAARGTVGSDDVPDVASTQEHDAPPGQQTANLARQSTGNRLIGWAKNPFRSMVKADRVHVGADATREEEELAPPPRDTPATPREVREDERMSDVLYVADSPGRQSRPVESPSYIDARMRRPHDASACELARK
eukprot:2620312-Amphidinium_carterae.6